MGPRREEIMEMARHAFAAGGVRSTSIRDLASGAGVLPSTLYSHFASKNDLIDEIMRDYVEHVIGSCHRAQATYADPKERLRALIADAIALLERYPAELAIHQRDGSYLSTLPAFAYFREMPDAVREIWLGAITEGVACGYIRDDIPPVVLYRWLRDAVFYTFNWFDPAEGLTAEQLSRAAFDMFFDGLGRPARSDVLPENNGSAVS